MKFQLSRKGLVAVSLALVATAMVQGGSFITPAPHAVPDTFETESVAVVESQDTSAAANRFCSFAPIVDSKACTASLASDCHEPNDNSSELLPVFGPGTYTARLNSSDRFDLYELQLMAGKPYTFTLINTGQVGDLDLLLYNTKPPTDWNAAVSITRSENLGSASEQLVYSFTNATGNYVLVFANPGISAAGTIYELRIQRAFVESTATPQFTCVTPTPTNTPTPTRTPTNTPTRTPTPTPTNTPTPTPTPECHAFGGDGCNEPANSVPAGAYVVHPGVYFASVSTFISTDPADNYSIVVPVGKHITVTIRATELDLDLALFRNNSPVALQSQGTFGTSNEDINNVQVANQSFNPLRIEVVNSALGSGTVPYTMTITVDP